ncbi:beta-N-acetylhexosaminidase [Aureicoccus marinus]|uniref:beta-N-acetylhexosaminidase n=1 Tax=Aureicoccus marinus TaxID=754435 RepID=A0A2S7T5A9_9FLAO|nr:beta-N-acetylhexosaminidase [Aureicoccus marinus]PQJ14636.1 beta-N-acetylhexosaminidase [Aureicoccus marinus]
MRIKTTLLLLLGTSLFSQCTPEKEVLNLPKTDLKQTAFLPWPSEILADSSAFPLDSLTPILLEDKSKSWQQLQQRVQAELKEQTGWELPLEQLAQRSPLVIRSVPPTDGGSEAYRLRIGQDTLFLEASDPAGAYRGLQSLKQNIPHQTNDTLANRRILVVPGGEINDRPRYAYRGMMLDVARHFFSVDEVKRLLDQLSYYKVNHLHLHLSDDQGWRIEIKGWPELTGIGAATEVGGTPGGFYTQEEYRELVDYAKSRYITIVPEIDMPGHTNAAVVSYPELNGNGKTPKPYTGTRVGFSTFDTRSDKTYAFLEDVIQQITALTDGPFFHVGGDESHVTKKEDYIYFLERVEPLITKAGKRMMGWDEIVQAKLGNSTVLQHWRTPENAAKGGEQGMQVVLSPAFFSYLDMKYDKYSEYGLTWAGFIPVDKAYNWNPDEAVTGLAQKNILGLEAPLWSETVSNSAELEYLAYPRMAGYAEMAWSQQEHREWDFYLKRLKSQRQRWDKEGINYYKSPVFGTEE